MPSRPGVWSYIRNNRFESLLVKNFALIFVLIVMPFTGMTFGVYRFYDTVLHEEIGAANHTTLTKLRDVMDTIMYEVHKLLARFATDEYIEIFLTSRKMVFPDYETISILRSIINAISGQTGDYIKSIYVYSDLNRYVLNSVSGGVAEQSFFDRGWYDDYHDKIATNPSRWVLPRRTGAGAVHTPERTISLFQRAPFSRSEKSGVVIMNLDYERLGRLFSGNESETHQWIYVLSDDDTILFTPDGELLGKAFDLLSGEDMRSLREGESITRKVGDERMVLSHTQSAYNDWQYVSMIPLGVYEARMLNMRRFIGIAIALTIFVSMVVAFVISVRVFEPIRNIISMLDDPDEYFDVVRSGQTNRIGNEYKYIASSIIHTIDESKHMETELQARMQLLRQSQTSALQAQISPHFLYNTLQTINWLAMEITHGENKASRVVNSLSRILRAIMETESPLVSLRDEIGYVREYIEIQRVRYPDKFTVVWQVDEELLDYAVAKITLQPIVENSIYHGIKPKGSRGAILLRASSAEDTITIEIIDDGVGMTDSAMDALNEALRSDYTKGDHEIGVRNINQRMKLIFGELHGITIRRHEPNGMEVKIVLPKVKIGHSGLSNAGEMTRS